MEAECPRVERGSKPIEFRASGPVEVARNGTNARTRRPAPACPAGAVIALSIGNGSISADELVEELWAGEPPYGRADHDSPLVRVAVARGARRRRRRSNGTSAGYAINLDPDRRRRPRFRTAGARRREALSRRGKAARPSACGGARRCGAARRSASSATTGALRSRRSASRSCGCTPSSAARGGARARPPASWSTSSRPRAPSIRTASGCGAS